MAKLSEESKKKIAESVKRSWVLRRAKLGAGSTKTSPAKHSLAKHARRLSADAKRRIAAAVKRSWIARRAGQPVRREKIAGMSSHDGILAAVERASHALRSATLADLRPLSGRRDAQARLEELVTLASDLRRMITP
jgi:hypothetical protein